MIPLRAPIDHRTLPACSIVVTDAGLLIAKIASIDKDLYGLVAYAAEVGYGTGFSLWGRRWSRVLSLPGQEHDDIVGRIAPEVLQPNLGKMVRVESGAIMGVLSTRDPQLIDEHRETLEYLAAILGVSTAALGIYGSAMYKPATERGDIDFVVYGEEQGRQAWERIQSRLPPVPRRKAGRPYHLHFPHLDGSVYLDPRLIRSDADTVALVRARSMISPGAALDRLAVTAARDAFYYPARYQLEDGSVLLSYRLGHCALLKPGDRISAAPLPTVHFDGVPHRIVLRYEHLTIHAGAEP